MKRRAAGAGCENIMNKIKVEDGYIIIRENGRNQKTAYLEVDASLTGYGSDILRALDEGSLEKWVSMQEQRNHDMYGDIEPDKDADLSWFILGDRPANRKELRAHVDKGILPRRKDIRDWDRGSVMPFGYLYTNKTLLVFKEGINIFSVTPSTVRKYIVIFENYRMLKDYLMAAWGSSDEKKFHLFLAKSSYDKIIFLTRIAGGSKIQNVV